MPTTTSSAPRSWTTRQLAWSCAGGFFAGAVLLYAVGFHWIGQWQTGETVQRQLAVAACVQEFLLQPDRGVVYAELQATTSAFQRRRLIENQKWASGSEVAELCDQRIRAFDATHFQQLDELPEEAAADQEPA